VLPIGVTMSVAIVDDGCTDGTASMVGESYPDVKIISGDGNLYWAGGMRFGWEQWVKVQPYDALLVFNDDIRLETNALGELIDTYHFARKMSGGLVVVSGAFRNRMSHEISYGGYVHSSLWHRLRFRMVEPTGSPRQIDTLNMNCALISSEALEHVGFLAEYFRHGGADMEFGLRLRKAGGTVWLTKKSVGLCDRNESDLPDTGEKLSLSENFKLVTSVKGEPVTVRFKYYRDHGGFLWPVLFLGLYVRIFLNAMSNYYFRKPYT
jgi:GT2 family glycosyltransferase